MSFYVVNPEIRDFLNNSHEPLDKFMKDFRVSAEHDGVPIILKETEELLSMLLRLKRPEKILEIGTATGYSATFFAKTCPGSEVYTIENDEFAYTEAIRNFKRAGVADTVRACFGDGREQIENLRDQGIVGFDFIFIDAAKNSYKRFMESSMEICRHGAVIVSDNILIHGLTVLEELDPKKKHKTHRKKMKEYIEFITGNDNLATSMFSVGDGIAVSILK